MERAGSLDVNPFYSERVKSDMVLRAASPERGHADKGREKAVVVDNQLVRAVGAT